MLTLIGAALQAALAFLRWMWGLATAKQSAATVEHNMDQAGVDRPNTDQTINRLDNGKF